jgi:trehalose/maltose hydrolase-like predicted phosphorylase
MLYSNTCEESTWTISFEGYEPEEEGHRESLCALGNGYFVTRAAAFEATADYIHYPGTYRAGIYNRLVSHIEGEDVDDESMVNLPNWLLLTFRINGGDWFSLDNVEIVSYRQILHLQHGVLQREIQFRDSQGQQTLLREQRFVSMDRPHLAGLNVELIAENWSGNAIWRFVRRLTDARLIITSIAFKSIASSTSIHWKPEHWNRKVSG